MSEASEAAEDALPEVLEQGRLHRGHNDDENNPQWVRVPAIIMLVACAVIVGVFIFSMIFLT